jgi:hypothetical protein
METGAAQSPCQCTQQPLFVAAAKEARWFTTVVKRLLNFNKERKELFPHG